MSNFDVDDMEELMHVENGSNCTANQVQYSLSSRGIEFDLLDWQQKRSMPLMAYCPLGGGDLVSHRALEPLAKKHGVTRAAIALAFLLTKPGVLAIPKTATPRRVPEIAAAGDVKLDAGDLAALDKAFPPPRRKQGLAMT